MRHVHVDIDEIIASTVDALHLVRARPVDLEALRARARELHRDPFGNLARLVESALHPKTRHYLIVTDLDAEAGRLRAFLRRHFLAYWALRRRLMRDAFVRAQLEARATGFLGWVTALDVFRYIAETSRGSKAVSLLGRAVVLLLPGFHHPESARDALAASVEDHPVLSRLADFSDPDLLSLVVRLHSRHEGAHSEDGMQHRAGVRNHYASEPESDATMTLFALREATLLDHEIESLLLSLAKLRELAGESYFFSGRAIRLCLEVEAALLVRLEEREITALGDAIADAVVPSYERLVKVERALAEMWELTRYRSMHHDLMDPRHDRMRALLADDDVEAWLSQTLGAFEHFGVCPREQRERVLFYASSFYDENERS